MEMSINNCTGATEFGDIVYYSHLIPIAISLVLVFFILKKSRFSQLSILFSLFLLSFSVWLTFDTVTWISTNPLMTLAFWVPLDFINIIFVLFAIYFFIVLVTGKDISWKSKISMILILLPAWIITATGNSVIGFNDAECEALNNGFLTGYKLIVEISATLFIIIFTLYSHNKISDLSKTRKHSSVSFALIIFLLTFSITEFISSKTGIYEINLYGLFILPIFLFIIIFAITNFKVFDIKIVGTQLLAYIMIILGGSQLFFEKNITDKILGSITLILSISFGILLLKASKRENEQLLHISSLATSLKTLNDTLEQKVAEQTQEIRKAYDLEKKAHRELEKLNETKNQFIMIAQHNLRVPVTNVKNKLNSMISDHPKLSNEETKKTIDEAKISIDHLLHIADDFKEIANLKVGSQILNISKTNLKPLLENILQELKIDIDNTNLRVTYPTNDSAWPEMKIDSHKIREVMQVIVENAIRYNIQNGNIEIKTENKNGMFEMIVENTGVGITTEEKENLLGRAFYRSKRAQIKNPVGMGIGLSLSRSIVEAHHGNLNIESGGENMGAKVTVTLPINYQFS